MEFDEQLFIVPLQLYLESERKRIAARLLSDAYLLWVSVSNTALSAILRRTQQYFLLEKFLAHLVERLAFNLDVVGANPTKLFFASCIC